jgi:GLPGLI family protein
MKKVILIIGVIIMIIAARIAFAQSEGVIYYDVKVNLHRTLPSDRQDEKAMIPEFRTIKQQLFFNAAESLYAPVPQDEDDEDDNGGGNVRMRIRTPKLILYTNPEKTESISQREFMGKDYLITDTLKMPPWKMGTDQKTILGYACAQAFYTDEENKQVITAWFTPDLRQELGPDRFTTLPGTVLALDINNGERVTVATKVDLRPLKKNELKPPSSGTPISRADFRKMVEERMKQMGGQNGRMIIRN